ncbi:MAG: phosphoribosylglycinamide formyltransferase [Candidatus Pacearchaeota archaeon]|nr:phosphoribosylglycinamide formyltransferase [Candidatus Pacearchaeota archaeon]
MELRLGFLASHRGSNVGSILDEIKAGKLEACPKLIMSNNPSAPVLDLGKVRDIPTFCLNGAKSPDKTILETLRKYGVNLVILAGYIKKLGPRVIEAYSNRILNIHPALLPKYGGKGMYGMRVHKEVINSEDLESGATIHIVTTEYDAGRILAQYKVPRYGRDTAETLAERVLRIEHVLYPQTLRDIQRGIINLD